MTEADVGTYMELAGSLRSGRIPLSRPHHVAEEIASRDLNNLYLASTFFADVERYKAFCAYYAVMRVVDDRIDDLPNRHALSDAELRLEHDVVSAWQQAILACYSGEVPPRSLVDRCGHPEASSLLESVARSLAVFETPSALWDSFFGAMRSDIERQRFDTWNDFLVYTTGASVAPTTVYLSLLATRRKAGEAASLVPDFDLFECGRNLGTFAYLGHILRDLAKDLRAGEEGLIYLTGEDLDAHGITEDSLFDDLARGKASPALRELVSELIERARGHLARGRNLIDPVLEVLEPDCRFILNLIVTVYERVLDKIEASSCDPLAGKHRLTLAEKRTIISRSADREGFSCG